MLGHGAVFRDNAISVDDLGLRFRLDLDGHDLLDDLVFVDDVLDIASLNLQRRREPTTDECANEREHNTQGHEGTTPPSHDTACM